MNDRRLTNSFKSYVGFDDDTLNASTDDSFSDQLNPRCLPGEMTIAEAQNVLMFSPVTENKQGKSGVLLVTNFKLSFVTTEEHTKEEMICQENLLLGEHDVCLSNVDALYHMGEKRRRLLPGKNISEKVKGLIVVCKNMKVLTFSFKFSPVGHGRNLTNALLHHAFPKRHQLLFAYDFREPYISYCSDTCLFRDPGEWGRELARTGSIGWRLSAVNKDFKMSTSLPEWIVVPSSATDLQLLEASRHFRAGRPPLWCWSSPHGAALARMADIHPYITDRVKENTMLETVRKSHPRLVQPIVLELNKDLPSPRDIQISFIKLRELCGPGMTPRSGTMRWSLLLRQSEQLDPAWYQDMCFHGGMVLGVLVGQPSSTMEIHTLRHIFKESERQFWVQDNHFLSLVENSKWLHYVSSCLSKALDAAKALYREVTVVLQEGDGRDMCCVIASLTQMLIDPYFRTLTGFQSLIQRDWVAMGHPFCTRLGHVYNIETQEAPVFLLFLDCVWQLLQQFPGEFQMTETYLTTLWDSAHISIFDTFLFDCERDRKLAAIEPNNPLTLRSIWDWGEQFSDRDLSLFLNPLYAAPPPTALRYPTSHRPLIVETGASALELWSQCYFRFIPIMELIGGGNPQIDLTSRLLVSQVEQIERELHQNSPNQEAEATNLLTQQPTLESLSCVGSFFPFSRQANAGPVAAALLVSSLSLNTSFQATEVMLDSQSILNAPD